MLVSTKGRYALTVLAHMAEHPADEYIPLKDIAQAEGISVKYLEAIVSALVKEGIVEGLRGKGGGYRLTKRADAITLASVLKLTETSLGTVSCLDKASAPCPKAADCRTLPIWKDLDAMIFRYLESKTIADLISQCEPGNDYVI